MHEYTSALEHMRKKIEMATEKICLAKLKEEQARKVCLLHQTQEYLSNISTAFNPIIMEHASEIRLYILLPFYCAC